VLIVVTVGMSQAIAAIAFPVLIIALIPLRWKVLPTIFIVREWAIMDALIADNDVVLASLGGKPRMQSDTKDKDVRTESPRSDASDNRTRNGHEKDTWSAAKRGTPYEELWQRAGE